MQYFPKNAPRALLVSAVSVSLFLTAACDTAPEDPYAAAVAASEEGDFQAARVFLRQALELKPHDPATILLYGKTQMALGNPVGAAEEFQKLEGDPDLGDEANVLLAQSYMQSGDMKLVFETLEVGGMKTGLAYAVASIAHLSEGDGKEAIAMLDQGLEKFPDSTDLLVLDARRAYGNREIDRARKLLASLLAKDPNMTEARLILGGLEMNASNFDKAKEQFSAVVRLNPENLPAILSLAALENDVGDKKVATEWLEKARKISPGHPLGIYFAAQMEYNAGNVDQAHMLVQSLGTQRSEFPALRLLRGLISAQRGETQTAISELERFFRLGGENIPARISLAMQYSSTGDDKKAWEMLEPVLRSANAPAIALKLGANLSGRLGRDDQARLVERARKAETRDPFAEDLVKAGIAIRAGKWDEADRIYQRALNAGGDSNVILLNNAANMRLKKGDKAGAIELARKAALLEPNDPIVMDTLGWSLVQADPNSAEGKDLIRRALELSPNNREIIEHWIAIS